MSSDRVLPATRVMSWVIVAILVPAVISLWLFPSRTADAWAWTFKPDMTALFMGSGYAAGTWFFVRAARSRTWHAISAPVLAAAIFAALMLIPTIIHWERFNHGDAPFVAAVAFYLWVGAYALAPPIVAALWLRNRREDPRRPEPGDPLVPPGVRLAARLIGLASLAAAATFLVAPDVAIDSWPWTLTPLTARVLACFIAQVGVGAVLLSLDERWSSWVLLLQSFLVATVFLLLGTIRAWDDFDHGAATWLFLAGLVGLAGAIVALYRAMSRPAARSG